MHHMEQTCIDKQKDAKTMKTKSSHMIIVINDSKYIMLIDAFY